MKVWIDITNSPHVLFFRPVIARLEEKGHKVIITAREYAQTASLLEKYGIDARLIGKHQGKSLIRKALGLICRSTRLILFARKKGVDLAVSHNSNDLAVAAKFLNIPQVTMFDYEYASTSHKLNFRLVDKILVPEILPDRVLKSFGAKSGQISKYGGLKEQVYLPFWDFDEKLPEKIGLDKQKIIVTMRPPATMSIYHRFENKLFIECLKELSKRKDCQVVLLPRTKQQEKEMLSNTKNVLIPPVVDGPSLIYHSDLVVGGGGTMNREAAALKVPAYTVFKGQLGAIDKYLIRNNKLIKIEKPDDIEVTKRKLIPVGKIDTNIEEVLKKILETAKVNEKSES